MYDEISFGYGLNTDDLLSAGLTNKDLELFLDRADSYICLEEGLTNLYNGNAKISFFVGRLFNNDKTDGKPVSEISAKDMQSALNLRFSPSEEREIKDEVLSTLSEIEKDLDGQPTPNKMVGVSLKTGKAVKVSDIFPDVPEAPPYSATSTDLPSDEEFEKASRKAIAIIRSLINDFEYTTIYSTS